MSRLATRLLASAAALALPLFSAAAPVDAKHVSADAKWYVHLDVEAARKTEVYTQALDAVRAQFPLEDVVASLKANLGVNPLTDINGITVYGNEFPAKDANGVKQDAPAAVLIHAKVDQKLLIQAVAQNPDYKAADYGKHSLNTWTDNNDGKTKAGCFYGDGLIIMADKIETLKSAVDVLDGKRNAGSALVKAPAKGAFIYGSADLAQSDDKNVSKLLSNSEAATAWAGEEGGNFVVHVNLVAKTPEQAADLKNLAEGAKAMGAMAAGDVPTAAAMLRKVQIAVDGAKVAASFQHDAKTLLQTLQKIDAENKAKAKAGATPDKSKGL